ncbi:7521_t:CDS:2, partial [Paraglomus occultum]
GHVTCRDPENPETFWMNPYGVHFSQIKVSDLALVNKKGEILYSNGDTYINQIGINLHSMLYEARPDIICATHCHSIYTRAFSSLVRPLDPITQDSCIFYEDHALYDYGGITTNDEEGRRIAKALGKKKAIILCNHGLVTVGHTVDEAAYLTINMERCCQVQLLAEAACHGNEKPIQINHECAKQVHEIGGTREA